MMKHLNWRRLFGGLLKALVIAVVGFGLLAISGFLPLAVIGVLFGKRYLQTNNHGFLSAAGVLIGLAAGGMVESAVGAEGGIYLLGGVACGFMGVYITDALKTQHEHRWSLVLGLTLLLMTFFLFTSSPDTKQAYLAIFPFGIFGLLSFAAYQYWRDRMRVMSNRPV